MESGAVHKSTHKWLITGANGNLGRRLILDLLSDGEDAMVAVVRSERAAARIEQDLAGNSPAARARVQVKVLNYTDVSALAAAAEDCDRAVHLVGVIKGDYRKAHEDSCQALIAALADSQVRHICYLSIVGSRPDAANACLASKGQAEQILREGPVPTCILRVPMVLGEGDYASAALAARAQGGTGFAFRADSLEQPIYAGDVVLAIRQAGQLALSGSFDLGGPESLPRRALFARAAARLGRSGRTISLPLGLGLLFAGLMEQFSGNPPVTRAMLGVLDHDDQIDSTAALAALQMSALTPLDEMLDNILQAGSA
ncbi:MAG: NAD(P)H-binding protein [Pseudomonadota bacterium]